MNDKALARAYSKLYKQEVLKFNLFTKEELSALREACTTYAELN